jgi:hypothetical protein
MSALPETKHSWSDALEISESLHEQVYGIFVEADELAINHRLPDVVKREQLKRTHYLVPEPFNSIRRAASDLESLVYRAALKFKARSGGTSRLG